MASPILESPLGALDEASYLTLAPGLAFLADLEGRVKGVNAAWERALGFSQDELRERPFAELLHPDDRPALEDAQAALRRGEPVCMSDGRFLRKEGAPRRLVWNASPRLDRGLVLGSAHDVTELYGRLRRFETLVHGTTDFIGMATLTGEVLYINPGGMAMVGRSGEDYRKLLIDSVRTEWGLKHSVEVMRPAALREGLWSGESEFQHAVSGAPIPVSQVFFVTRDDAGEPESFASIARDLTPQKRVEAELRRFKALVDATSDFIGIARLAERRSEGAMEYVNAAGMAMLGRAGEDCRTLTLGDLHANEALRRLEGQVFGAVEASGIWSGETELQRADGATVPVSMVVTLLRDGEDRPEAVAAIARDLTARRRADALEDAIRVMSVPILQVSDGVLALPIIGLMDSTRAAQATEALLEAIVRTRCRIAILDLTGVEAVDSGTVSHLFTMISAASLLGSRCVVSGISPAVAQTVTQLGLDVSSLRSFRTLQESLRFARASLAGRASD